MVAVKGKVNSIQTLGAVDGPGVRFVVFLQGCPLNCVCCHNPETKSVEGGIEFTAKELAEKAERYRPYFKTLGGVTVSGGEPLLQPQFVEQFFKECHKRAINTCLDTSGFCLNDQIKAMLKETDLVLLDIKYTSDEKYQSFVGCSLSSVLEFLQYLEEKQTPTWIRQVIIPGINDSEDDVLALKSLLSGFKCITRRELLPFKKLCETKYCDLGLNFPLKNTAEPDKNTMARLQKLLDDN